MLDGRVLGASQVEYKPFGKPGNAGILWRNPALNSPQSLIQRASTQVPTQVPFVPFVFTFLPRQAAEPPLSPGSLLYALNFNMSDYMSDEHVLGTPGAPPCRAKPLNPHSLRAPCYMCYMCYILHAKPLNIHSPPVLAICAICAISYTPSR